MEVSADAEAPATTMRDQDDPSPAKEPATPNHNRSHQFYAGVLLHARSMFVHILSAKGKTVFERDLLAEPDAFLDAVKPFRKNLVVGCECMFAWYWLADLCEETPNEDA